MALRCVRLVSAVGGAAGGAAFEAPAVVLEGHAEVRRLSRRTPFRSVRVRRHRYLPWPGGRRCSRRCFRTRWWRTRRSRRRVGWQVLRKHPRGRLCKVLTEPSALRVVPILRLRRGRVSRDARWRLQALHDLRSQGSRGTHKGLRVSRDSAGTQRSCG